jgi:hypothetical protein
MVDVEFLETLLLQADHALSPDQARDIATGVNARLVKEEDSNRHLLTAVAFQNGGSISIGKDAYSAAAGLYPSIAKMTDGAWVVKAERRP